MEFHGKLYGKIAGTFFDNGKTTDDYANTDISTTGYIFIVDIS